MYFGSISDLLPCLESSINVPPTNTNDPAVDGMVLDGCVMLRFIPSDADSTFQMYVDKFVSIAVI